MIEHDLAKGSDICFVCGCIGVESRDAFNCSTFNICPCCGAEFGYEDYTLESTRRYRAAWLASGATWRDSEAKPAKWDVDTQLANIPPEHQ